MTCTEEYPFVTFLTLRTTLDMMPVQKQEEEEGEGIARETD